MKETLKFFGIIAIMMVIGLSIVACTGQNPFKGTWTGTDPDGDKLSVVIEDSTFSISYPGIPNWIITGTYVYDGNTATFVIPEEGLNGTGVVTRNTMVLTIAGVGAFILSK